MPLRSPTRIGHNRVDFFNGQTLTFSMITIFVYNLKC